MGSVAGRHHVELVAEDLEEQLADVFFVVADENARAIVRPSPDLLYAGCAFDLADGPLRIQATVPRDTYWSLSMFAANTDNFFVVNDRAAKSALDAGVKMIACQMTMDLFEYKIEDMIEGPAPGGAATYMEEALKSDINLFI